MLKNTVVRTTRLKVEGPEWRPPTENEILNIAKRCIDYTFKKIPEGSKLVRQQPRPVDGELCIYSANIAKCRVDCDYVSPSVAVTMEPGYWVSVTAVYN